MPRTERPNILFILADDLGWGDVSYHGAAIRTPNIDRLVQSGVELDQHYVCPMCTPTRACLMTGRHPGRFGRHATTPSNPPVLPDGYETLAVSLRNREYDTGLFGKWHLGSDPKFGPNHFGFNTAYGSLAGGVDIMPLLSEQVARIDRKPLFWNFRGNCFGAREGDWKLIADDRMDPEHAELFDLAADPYETLDLAARQPERVHQLLEVIAAERKFDGTSKRDDVD